MIFASIEEAKKLADKIHVDEDFEAFAKLEKEGKDLDGNIGFRHDWQMWVIEEEDKVEDITETNTHLQEEKSVNMRYLCYYRGLCISKTDATPY